MTPAEKLAVKKKKDSTLPKWGARRHARRTVIFPSNTLKSTREELGLTQCDVATGSGVNSATVADAEAGFEVMLTNALKLAAFFGKSVEQLWPKENR